MLVRVCQCRSKSGEARRKYRHRISVMYIRDPLTPHHQRNANFSWHANDGTAHIHKRPMCHPDIAMHF